jgi:hypothetical protein
MKNLNFFEAVEQLRQGKTVAREKNSWKITLKYDDLLSCTFETRNEASPGTLNQEDMRAEDWYVVRTLEDEITEWMEEHEYYNGENTNDTGGLTKAYKLFARVLEEKK